MIVKTNAITLQQVCAYLDATLSSSSYLDCCPNGLQIEGKPYVQKIATAVSASLEVIEKAVNLGVDLLLVHHGVFWNKESPVISGTKRKKIAHLLKNEISLLAYHLPLDAHQELGNNWKAAMDLGWKDLQPFGVFNGLPIGVKGTFAKKEISRFQKELEEYYKHTAHAASFGKQEVSSVALISGGAHREIALAAQDGVDCYVTGSFDEPVWHIAKEEGLNFFALGHSATEVIGPKALGEHLAQKFSFQNVFISCNNPF